MDARDIIFNFFDTRHDDDLCSLMGYLDTDTLVSWFVDEGYADCLDDDERKFKFIEHYYDLHCRR